MTQSLSLLHNRRNSQWLLPPKHRRMASMVSKAAGRAHVKILHPQVYCNPVMPKGWTEIAE
jgi:hypothetical protein